MSKTTPNRKVEKQTAKQRKALERSEPKVLVGFGVHSLKSLMADRDSYDGEERLLYAVDKFHWPPRYRRAGLCTIEEIQTFRVYLKWLEEMFCPPEAKSEQVDVARFRAASGE